MLKGNNFYRCHRSFIINLDKITEIEQWFNSSWILKIKNYTTAIPVSRNNIKELKELEVSENSKISLTIIGGLFILAGLCTIYVGIK